MDEDTTIRLSLRLPRETHEAVTTAATTDKKSVNNALLDLISEGLASRSPDINSRKFEEFLGNLLFAQVKNYMQANKIRNETGAVRGLVREALQNHETIEDIVDQVDEYYSLGFGFRDIVREILSLHILVNKIEIGPDALEFALTNNRAGRIDISGVTKVGNLDDSGFYGSMNHYTPRRRRKADQRASAAEKRTVDAAVEASTRTITPADDLDDEIPF